MVKDNLNGLMEIVILVILLITKEKATEFINGIQHLLKIQSLV
jgi:hypothetical protein